MTLPKDFFFFWFDETKRPNGMILMRADVMLGHWINGFACLQLEWGTGTCGTCQELNLSRIEEKKCCKLAKKKNSERIAHAIIQHLKQ